MTTLKDLIFFWACFISFISITACLVYFCAPEPCNMQENIKEQNTQKLHDGHEYIIKDEQNTCHLPNCEVCK